jgi:hypothetical protein
MEASHPPARTRPQVSYSDRHPDDQDYDEYARERYEERYGNDDDNTMTVDELAGLYMDEAEHEYLADDKGRPIIEPINEADALADDILLYGDEGYPGHGVTYEQLLAWVLAHPERFVLGD